MSEFHVLIIDPDERKRALLRTYLARQGFLVSTARGVDHAARLLSGLDFDLLVSEDIAGAEGLGEMTSGALLLLATAERAASVSGEAMVKPFDPPALLARINDILDRAPEATAPPQTVLRLGRLTYDVETGMLMEGDARIRLTATENVLMRTLAARAGAPITRAELCDAVGGAAPPTARAVDVQITRLRRKLEIDPKVPRVLQTVRGTGYMLSPDQP